LDFLQILFIKVLQTNGPKNGHYAKQIKYVNLGLKKIDFLYLPTSYHHQVFNIRSLKRKKFSALVYILLLFLKKKLYTTFVSKHNSILRKKNL